MDDERSLDVEDGVQAEDHRATRECLMTRLLMLSEPAWVLEQLVVIKFAVVSPPSGHTFGAGAGAGARAGAGATLSGGFARGALWFRTDGGHRSSPKRSVQQLRGTCIRSADHCDGECYAFNHVAAFPSLPCRRLKSFSTISQ